jgi:hypothetical protein
MTLSVGRSLLKLTLGGPVFLGALAVTPILGPVGDFRNRVGECGGWQYG